MNVSDFAELFQGRTDAVGTNEGGCERIPEQLQTDVAWNGRFTNHLTGEAPMGIYPLMDDLTVRWGCVDFDEGYEQSWPDAVNLRAVLEQFDITAWIEKSRSKGYHVWIFASESIPAQLMRQALIGACSLVDAPMKEVNPKQTELNGGLGNYVRLPYPGVFHNPELITQVMIEPWQSSTMLLGFNLFVEDSLSSRCTAAQLEPLVAFAPELKVIERTETPEATELDITLTRKMSGLTWTIFNDGPLDGDRSSGLWKLCKALWEDGNYTKDEAWAVVCDADRRWGKFIERGDEDVLWTTLEKAWN